MAQKIEGAKFLTELPGPGPWRLILWDGGVLAVSPTERPRHIVGDSVTILDLVPPGID